ncbi:MAG: RluA family pseudouridine synthase [Cyclobacteriaceae bacterium]|nr:RluA family pseudouridine synthase [Cyclobacteriaceae bacterium]
MKKVDLRKFIIYQDEHFLAINKPSGISVLADRSGDMCVLDWVRTQFEDASACHRIDKDTSGVLLFALDKESYRHASLQFQNRQIKKVYHALVYGKASFHEYRENRNIAVHDQYSSVHKEGKDAETWFDTLGIYYEYSLVECKPITGRMHQIRVHLQALGFPIVADALYGGSPLFLSEIKKKYKLSKYDDEQPLMGRLALHAYKLEFQNRSGDRVCVEAPYSKDFKAAINQLAKIRKVKK